MLPEGLRYVDSWVEVNGHRCFQLMECDNEQVFQQWVARWNDLVDFEIVAVRTSKEAVARHESGGNGPEERLPRTALGEVGHATKREGSDV
jgi:hypothetical protein